MRKLDEDKIYLQGYGVFITNQDKFKPGEEEKLRSDKFYAYYYDKGYELKIGPPQPATNGKIYSEYAIYISNYYKVNGRKDGNDTGKNTSSVEQEKDTRISVEENESNILTDEIIGGITQKFITLIRYYDTAQMHANMGLNIQDAISDLISKIYSYESEIITSYKGKDLYLIIRKIKDEVKVNNKAKSHIIYTLENALFEEVFNNQLIQENEKIQSLVSDILKYIKNYNMAKMHMHYVDVSQQYNQTLDDINDFINKVNKYTLEERCAIVYYINNHYALKNENLPDGLEFVINNIRNGIFESVFEKEEKKLTI